MYKMIKNYKTYMILLLVLNILFITLRVNAELRLQNVIPTMGNLGEDLKVKLIGNGFDANTRVSMSPGTMYKKEIVRFVNTPGYANGVTVAGDYAYIASGGSGLQVIDISNPYFPILGSADTPGCAQGVAVAEKYAYVADGMRGLQVIDVSDPSDPNIIGSFETGSEETPGYAYGVAVAGKYAYVAYGKSGLQVIDVSTPSSPVVIKTVETPDNARGVVVVGKYAYVADGKSGLQVIDVSTPSSPNIIKSVAIGAVEILDSANGVAVVGEFAYIAYGGSGLRVIDVSDPSNPNVIGSVVTPGYANGVTVAGDYAYVADGGSGMQVIDVSDPSKPTILGSVVTPSSANGVAISGEYAFVADCYSGLWVVDLGTPSNPIAVGAVDTPDSANRVVVVGDYAYVADGSSGLQVIDVSNPSDPEIIGDADTPGSAKGVVVVEENDIGKKYAYVADGSSGLQVIDVSNPSGPEIIGDANTPGFANGVVVVGDYAYVADGSSGLQVIDVSNPFDPNIIGHADTSGFAKGVVVVENDIGKKYAYVVDWKTVFVSYSNPLNRFLGEGESLKYESLSSGYTLSGPTLPVSTFPEYTLPVPTLPEYTLPEYTLPVPALPVPTLPEYTWPGYTWTVPPMPFPTLPEYTWPGYTWTGYMLPGYTWSESPWSVSPLLASPWTVPLWSGFPSYPSQIPSFQSKFYVIDVSDPSNPNVIESVDMVGSVHGITLAGEYAFVMGGGSFLPFKGLQVIDVSNPSAPEIIGFVATPGYANEVTVIGDYAYVADGKSGLQVFDVSNLSNPVLIGSVHTQSNANGVTMADGHVYIADGGSGLRIILPPVEIEDEDIFEVRETEIFLNLPGPKIPGHYTLRVFNKEEGHELVDAVTFVQWGSPVTKEKAIIVASRGPNDSDEEWDETQLIAKCAYNALIKQGYAHEMIYYLNSDTNYSEFDYNPNINIIADLATYENLYSAINIWTTGPTPSQVLIFFVGHGANGEFKINTTKTLKAQELNEWLDTLQKEIWLDPKKRKMPGYIIFIYGACHSGSFLDPLTSSSPEKRIIITSCASNEVSYYTYGGKKSFSYIFWDTLKDDSNLLSVFNDAKDRMIEHQRAQLEANGNGSPNEQNDKDIAGTIEIGRGFSEGSDSSCIGSISPPQQLNGEHSATFWVENLSIEKDVIERVWAEITPPHLDLDSDSILIDSDSILIEVDLELIDTNEISRYEGNYGKFSEEGTYIVTINLERNDKKTSASRQTTVTQLDGDETAEHDEYDEDPGDDTFTLASSIVIDAEEPQYHNFHDANDEDWISFYGVSGKIYMIKAAPVINFNPVIELCNPVIELYESDGVTVTLIAEKNDQISGWDEVFYLDCNKDAVYYVKIRNFNPNLFGENTKYEFSISLPIHPFHGYLQGTLRDLSGTPIEGVWIITDAGLSDRTNSSGKYILVHPKGTCTIILIKPGYKAVSYPDQKIPEGETIIKDFLLESLPNTPFSVEIDSPSNAVTIYEGEYVSFQGSVVGGGKGPFIYLWDFNGGAPNADVEDPGNVTFKTQGEYDVTLITSDSDGYTDESQTVTVKVLAKPSSTESDSGKGGVCFIKSALMP